MAWYKNYASKCETYYPLSIHINYLIQIHNNVPGRWSGVGWNATVGS